MKTNTLSLSLIFAIAMSFHTALAGVKEGGGGDALAFEFVTYAQAWDRLITSLPEADRHGIDSEAFHNALIQTLVRTQDRVELDGEVDAMNEGTQITLSRRRWSQNSKSQRLLISLHEYLGILHLDRKYEISAPMMDSYGERALTLAGGRGSLICTINAFETELSKVDSVYFPSNTQLIANWTGMMTETEQTLGKGIAMSGHTSTISGTPLNVTAIIHRSKATLALTNGQFAYGLSSGTIGVAPQDHSPNDFPELSESELVMPVGNDLPSVFDLKTATYISDKSNDALMASKNNEVRKVSAELFCAESRL